MINDGLAAARDAFARQDWKQAYAGFSAADDVRAQVSAGDLERLAIAAYMLGKDESAPTSGRVHTPNGCGCTIRACGTLHLLASARPADQR